MEKVTYGYKFCFLEEIIFIQAERVISVNKGYRNKGVRIVGHL